MKVVTVRKTEGLPCKLCNHSINYSEDAFCFYNKGKYHFVHALCQFSRKKRNVTLEQFLKDAKFQSTLRQNKKTLKAKTVEESAKLYSERMKRYTPLGHTPLWYDK